MKNSKQYNSPDLSVIEITEKEFVMIGGGEGSTPDQFSRDTKPYDNEDADVSSRRQSNVWDEE